MGYPADDDESLVIGVDMNGSANYSIDALIGVEVTNDHFGDDYVAVAY